MVFGEFYLDFAHQVDGTALAHGGPEPLILLLQGRALIGFVKPGRVAEEV